jgi:hypothetical protein
MASKGASSLPDAVYFEPVQWDLKELIQELWDALTAEMEGTPTFIRRTGRDAVYHLTKEEFVDRATTSFSVGGYEEIVDVRSDVNGLDCSVYQLRPSPNGEEPVRHCRLARIHLWQAPGQRTCIAIARGKENARSQDNAFAEHFYGRLVAVVEDLVRSAPKPGSLGLLAAPPIPPFRRRVGPNSRVHELGLSPYTPPMEHVKLQDLFRQETGGRDAEALWPTADGYFQVTWQESDFSDDEVEFHFTGTHHKVAADGAMGSDAEPTVETLARCRLMRSGKRYTLIQIDPGDSSSDFARLWFEKVDEHLRTEYGEFAWVPEAEVVEDEDDDSAAAVIRWRGEKAVEILRKHLRRGERLKRPELLKELIPVWKAEQQKRKLKHGYSQKWDEELSEDTIDTALKTWRGRVWGKRAEGWNYKKLLDALSEEIE